MPFANVGNYVMLLFYIQFYLNLAPFTKKYFEFCLDILNAKLLITKMKIKNILIFNIEPAVHLHVAGQFCLFAGTLLFFPHAIMRCDYI